MKKLICIALCLCLLLGLAVTALAATAPSDPKQIVDEAFALEKDKSLDYTATLTGTITSIKDAYSAQYKNISVYMDVEGTTGTKSLLVYRLKGEGADTLAAGDTITVTGTIKNYNGTIEFISGCTLDKVVKGANETPTAPADSKLIVDAAFALEAGKSLPYQATLTGKITGIKDAYSTQYKNISVYMDVEGTTGTKSLLVYRLKGEGADKLAVGDTITVTGTIVNYNGTIEFNSGCQLTAVVAAPTTAPTTAPTVAPTQAPTTAPTVAPTQGNENPSTGDNGIVMFTTLLFVAMFGIVATVTFGKKHF